MDGPTLSCGVCEELYTKGERRPRALLCGHTFCTLCLDEAIRAKSCNCPTCNQPFIAFTATQLPTDFPTLQKITSSSSSVSGSYGSLARKSYRDTTSSDELDSLRSGFSKLSSSRYEPRNRDSIPENTALYKAPDKEEGNIRSNRWQSAQRLSFPRNYTDNKVYTEGNSDETDSLGSKQKDLSAAFSKRRTYATSFDHKPLSRADDVLNRNYSKLQPRENAAHPANAGSPLKSASDTPMATLKSPEDQSYEQESSRLTPSAGSRAKRPSSDSAKGRLSPKLDIDSKDTNSLTVSPGDTTNTPQHVLRMCRSLTSKHLTSGREYYPNQARPATPTSDESSDDDMADILGPPPPLPGTGPPDLPKSSSPNDQGNVHEGGTADKKISESGVSVAANTCEGLAPNENNAHQDLKTSEYDKKNGVQTPTESQSRSDSNRSLRARLSRRALSLQYALNDDENVSKEPLHFTKSESYNSRSSSITTPSEEESKENRRKLDSVSYHSKTITADKPEINDTEKETNSVNRSFPQSNFTKKDTSYALSTTPAQDTMQTRRGGYENLRVKSEWKYRTKQEETSNTHLGGREDAGKSHWSDRMFRLSSPTKVKNGGMSGRSKSVDEGELKDISIPPSTTSKDEVDTNKAKNLWSKPSPERLEEPHDSFYPDHKKSECSQTQDGNQPKNADVSFAITPKDKEGAIAKVASVRDWKIPRELGHEEDPDDKKTKTSDTSSLKTTSASRSRSRYKANSSTNRSPIGLLRIGIVPSTQTDGEENEQTDATKDLDTIDSSVMSRGRRPRVMAEGEETSVLKNRVVTGFVSSKRQHENSLGGDAPSSSVRYPASKTIARNNFGGKQALFETRSHDASSDDANIWKNFSRRHRHGEPSKHSDPYAQKSAESEDAAERTYKEQSRYPKLHHTSANDTSKHKRDPSKQDRAQRLAKGHQTSRDLKRKTSPTPAVVVLQKLPDAGLCGTHGSIVQLYCQRCEMWICEECLDILHAPSPKGLCRVISTSEALLGLKEKHSEFITSRINTLSHFRRDLQKLLHECEDSIEEHEATILELRAKAEEEEAQMEGINVLKTLALEKCKQIDTWEDLLQKSAKRIEKSGTSQAMISAVEWNKAEILKKFQENAELEVALSSDSAE